MQRMNINTPNELRDALLKVRKQNKKALFFGYDDGYYWEQWYLYPLSDAVLVVFKVGSCSGYIEEENDVKEMSYQELFGLLKDKLFENEENSLIDILDETLDAENITMKSSHRHPTDYNNVEIDIDDLLNLIGVTE